MLVCSRVSTRVLKTAQLRLSSWSVDELTSVKPTRWNCLCLAILGIKFLPKKPWLGRVQSRTSPYLVEIHHPIWVMPWRHHGSFILSHPKAPSFQPNNGWSNGQQESWNPFVFPSSSLGILRGRCHQPAKKMLSCEWVRVSEHGDVLNVDDPQPHPQNVNL